MKKIIITAFLLVLANVVLSQNDSSKVAINTSAESKSDLIAKSRRMLLDKFVEKDFYRVMTEMEYLMSLDDENYIALYPQEFWLLSFWIKDYKSILTTIASPDSGITDSKTKRIPPQNDYLTIKVIEKTRERERSIIDEINNTSLEMEEKDFLVIVLKFLDELGVYVHPRQAELNTLADIFLNAYPSGKYANFVKKFVRVKYEPSSNGFGYSISAGALLFTGNLKNNFNNPTFVGLGIDALKNKWLFQLNIGLAFGKTKVDMPVNGYIWPSGSKALGGHIDFAAGYYVFENRGLEIAPYASVGIFGLDPNGDTEKQPELKKAGINTNVAGTLGFMTDFRLKTKSVKSNSIYMGDNTQTTALRLTYGYIVTPERNKYVDLSGSVHKITLGIALMGRKNKRVE